MRLENIQKMNRKCSSSVRAEGRRRRQPPSLREIEAAEETEQIEQSEHREPAARRATGSSRSERSEQQERRERDSRTDSEPSDAVSSAANRATVSSAKRKVPAAAKREVPVVIRRSVRLQNRQRRTAGALEAAASSSATESARRERSALPPKSNAKRPRKEREEPAQEEELETDPYFKGAIRLDFNPFIRSAEDPLRSATSPATRRSARIAERRKRSGRSQEKKRVVEGIRIGRSSNESLNRRRLNALHEQMRRFCESAVQNRVPPRSARDLQKHAPLLFILKDGQTRELTDIQLLEGTENEVSGSEASGKTLQQIKSSFKTDAKAGSRRQSKSGEAGYKGQFIVPDPILRVGPPRFSVIDCRFPVIELQSGRVLYPFRWASQIGQNRWSVSAVEYSDMQFYFVGNLVVPGGNVLNVVIVRYRRVVREKSRLLKEYLRWLAGECEAHCRATPIDPFPILDICFFGFMFGTAVHLHPVRLASATSGEWWDVTGAALKTFAWPLTIPPAFIYRDVAPTYMLTFRQQNP